MEAVASDILNDLEKSTMIIAKKNKRNDGFALLVVILIIAVLGAMVTEFLYSARLQAELLANHRDGMKARYIGRSAMNTYIYLLETNMFSTANEQNLFVLSNYLGIGNGMQNVKDGQAAESLLGIGANPLDPDPEGFMRGQWSIPLPSDIFILDGKMYGRMTNERGKINLNALVVINRVDRGADQYNRKVYNQLVKLSEVLQLDPEKALTCFDGIVDWIDGDYGTEPRGAEDDYYRSLDIPYYPRNNFLIGVDEIRLVKGCTPEIVDKIRDFITVYPLKGPITSEVYDPRIDAAAAPKAVLMAVLMAPEDETSTSRADPILAAQIAEEIYLKAVEKCGISITIGEAGAPSVSSPTLLLSEEVVTVIGGRIAGEFDFYSYNVQDPQFYDIQAYGEVNGTLAGIEAIVRKDPFAVKTVFWRED